MHAMTVPTPGGPDALKWAEIQDPECGPGDVIIDVAATAVNRADLLQRQGQYPPPPGAPEWPGLECSGVISEIGGHVTSWQVGDAVCALLAGGGYAERVAVPERQVLPVPRGVDLVSATALPETVCTVWANVVVEAGLLAGEMLLVHGGASGIGTTAIQIAAAMGAQVAVTAGSDDKLSRCADLGASVLINYRTDDFVQVLHDGTDGHGADVILDIIGAKYLSANLTALADDGRLVVVGLQGGRKGELDLAMVLRKRARITGSLLRSRSTSAKAEIVAQVRAGAWPLIESGRVKPVIDRTLPMRDAAEAHRVVEASAHIGKVLLVTDHQISG